MLKRLFPSLALLMMPTAVLVGCGGGTSSSTTGSGGATSSSQSSAASMTTTTTTTVSATSSTGSSSSSSTGGMNVMATDKCPGNVVDMPIDSSVSLTGTTIGATDDYKEFCGDAGTAVGMGAPDVVYQVKIEQRCSFFLNFTEQGTWDGALAIRKVCDTRNQGADFCINGATHGESFKGEMAPGTYFIIVDGAGKTQSGAYNLNLQCLTPKCGDGVLNTAEEQCDLGPNPPAGSGCGAPGTPNACKLTPATAADTCADATTPINITTAATTANPLLVPAMNPLFDTRVAKNDYTASCSNTPIAGGPGLDQVFKFVPATTGKLSVTIGQDKNGVAYCQPPNYDQPECWIHFMWFKSVCSQAAPELPLSNTTPPGTPTTTCIQSDNSATATDYVIAASVNVIAGQPVYLFVQGNTQDPIAINQNGPYLLRATLQ